MKKLIFINGPMAVGKSSVCKILNKKLPNSVWLDGNWCCMMNPFKITSENEEMIIDNISYVLRNYLLNSNIENIILSWTIRTNEAMESILRNISLKNYKFKEITLTCSKSILKKRISKDIASGKREVESLEKTLEFLKYYNENEIDSLDTSQKDKIEVASEIIKIINSM